jgi:hypothetical protein
MAQKPSKRQRVGGAYHDSVPFTDDFSLIHAREGKLLRVGNDLLTAPAERSPQQDDYMWNSASSWLPADDPQFALDPDGEWYDEVVDGGIMEDFFPSNGLASTTQPKKHVKSKVAVGLHSFWPNIDFNVFLAKASCCMERITSTRIPRGDYSLGRKGRFSGC